MALTAVIAFASSVWLMVRPVERSGMFALHFGIGETAVLGAFLAEDLALFVLFFDLMLVPFYFLVGQWGGPERVAAAIKMVIYALVGSLLMLAAAVATAVLSADTTDNLSFVLTDLYANPLHETTQKWLFVAFALAFLIKMPAFPFHGWMPDAYRTMPLPALAFFSGVVSKVAAYGFLKLVLPLFPAATEDFHTILLILAVLSILYGSLQAFTQTNGRLILGYSSIAQLGFITLGIFAIDGAGQGAQGALLQAVNHRLLVGAAVLRAGAARRARRGIGGHPRLRRDRVPRAGARGAVPDRRARDAGDAGLGQLRRRVPDPARDVRDVEDDRDHRLAGRDPGVRLRTAVLHPLDAQPSRA